MELPSRARPVDVVLLGWGPVGRAFHEVVAEDRPSLAARFGFDVRVRAIVRASGTGYPGDDDAVTDWSSPADLRAVLGSVRPHVVVQAVPSDPGRAGEAYDQVVAAMEADADAVTATKSHLVTRWVDLEREANARHRRIRISAAAGAALPAADLARRSLRGFRCDGIRGSLNGTANFVLDEVAGGTALADAVRQAQAAGIAEANVESDLGGRDAAAKLVILGNLLWDARATLDDVALEPIEPGIEERARRAKAAGRALRAVASAGPAGRRQMAVRLEETEPGDPLHGLVGPDKGVEFDCGSEGRVWVSGGRSSPRGAARAMLKDVLDLSAGTSRYGFG